MSEINEQQNNQPSLANAATSAAIVAVAAASKAPFKTAFALTMGIFAARLLSFIIVVSILSAIAFTAYKLLH